MKDYVVKTGEILYLEDGNTYEFRTLTLQKGAQIQVQGKVILRVETLIKESE